jgi:hypothetical protein
MLSMIITLGVDRKLGIAVSLGGSLRGWFGAIEDGLPCQNLGCTGCGADLAKHTRVEERHWQSRGRGMADFFLLPNRGCGRRDTRFRTSRHGLLWGRITKILRQHVLVCGALPIAGGGCGIDIR